MLILLIILVLIKLINILMLNLREKYSYLIHLERSYAILNTKQDHANLH